jgi:hypothetical protein
MRSTRAVALRCGQRAGTLSNEVRSAIDESGVDLHQRRAGVDLLLRIGAGQDAADADDRQRAVEGFGERADDRVACARQRPDSPPDSSAWGRPRTASRAKVVFVAITPSTRWRTSSRAIPSIAGTARSGAIFTAIGVYLPCRFASTDCSALSVASRPASASSDWRSRRPLVFGDETLTVT